MDHLYQMIFDITQHNVKSFHTDLSSRTGERMMIFKMHDNLEQLFIK